MHIVFGFLYLMLAWSGFLQVVFVTWTEKQDIKPQAEDSSYARHCLAHLMFLHFFLCVLQACGTLLRKCSLFRRVKLECLRIACPVMQPAF